MGDPANGGFNKRRMDLLFELLYYFAVIDGNIGEQEKEKIFDIVVKYAQKHRFDLESYQRPEITGEPTPQYLDKLLKMIALNAKYDTDEIKEIISYIFEVMNVDGIIELEEDRPFRQVSEAWKFNYEKFIKSNGKVIEESTGNIILAIFRNIGNIFRAIFKFIERILNFLLKHPALLITILILCPIFFAMWKKSERAYLKKLDRITQAIEKQGQLEKPKRAMYYVKEFEKMKKSKYYDFSYQGRVDDIVTRYDSVYYRKIVMDYETDKDFATLKKSYVDFNYRFGDSKYLTNLTKLINQEQSRIDRESYLKAETQAYQELMRLNHYDQFLPKYERFKRNFGKSRYLETLDKRLEELNMEKLKQLQEGGR